VSRAPQTVKRCLGVRAVGGSRSRFPSIRPSARRGPDAPRRPGGAGHVALSVLLHTGSTRLPGDRGLLPPRHADGIGASPAPTGGQGARACSRHAAPSPSCPAGRRTPLPVALARAPRPRASLSGAPTGDDHAQRASPRRCTGDHGGHTPAGRAHGCGGGAHQARRSPTRRSRRGRRTGARYSARGLRLPHSHHTRHAAPTGARRRRGAGGAHVRARPPLQGPGRASPSPSKRSMGRSCGWWDAPSPAP
jgi:hypothetical protein